MVLLISIFISGRMAIYLELRVPDRLVKSEPCKIAAMVPYMQHLIDH